MASGAGRVAAYLYLSTATGLLGAAIATVGLPLAILYSTGSIGLAGALAAASEFPALVLALPLGALADRLPRRPVVILGRLGEAGCVAAITVLLASDRFTLVAALGIGAARGVLSQFAEAAFAGYIPTALGRQSLLRYNSRIEVIEGGAALVGPSIAGSVVQFVGALWGAASSGITSALNAVIFFFLPDVPKPKMSDTRDGGTGAKGALQRVARDTVAGARFVLKSPVQLTLAVFSLFLAATTTSYGLVLVFHMTREVGLSATITGVVMAASGVGGIVAAILLEKFVSMRHTWLLLVISTVGATALLVMVPWLTSPFLLAAALFLLDAAWVAGFIYSGTARACLTPDALLSRVESVDTVVFSLGSFLALGVITLMLDSTSSAVVMPIIVAAAIPTLIALFLLRQHFQDIEPIEDDPVDGAPADAAT